MLQIIDSVTTTVMKYGYDFLPWAAAVILVITIGGIALRFLRK